MTEPGVTSLYLNRPCGQVSHNGAADDTEYFGRCLEASGEEDTQSKGKANHPMVQWDGREYNIGKPGSAFSHPQVISTWKKIDAAILNGRLLLVLGKLLISIKR